MESSGYIKLFRKFLEWEWYDDINCKVVFIHLLIKANYKEKQWRGKTIRRGQLFTSIDNLASELHLTTKQIRITISKLESTGEIVKNGASEGTYITVCNYDNYQQSEQTEGQAEGERRANEGQTKGEPGATTNNNKNIKKEKKVRSKPIKSADFIDQIIDQFIQAHGSYEVLSIGKERSAAGKLLKKYKEKYPAATSEETLTAMRQYFNLCVKINDDWLRTNMSLPTIIDKFNQINTILRNGGIKKPAGATDAELADIYARKFGIDSPEREY